MLKNYELSILIPAWNAEKYILECINSILDNDYQNYKIILIVGGIDNTLNLALKFQRRYHEKIKLLLQQIPNKNKELNIGLEEADGNIIILTDIDCIFPEFWLKKIDGNVRRDEFNYKELSLMGWGHLIIWQCQIKKGMKNQLKEKIANFLEG